MTHNHNEGEKCLACQEGGLQNVIDQMLGNIDEYGWGVIGVFDADPPFTYSVGLTKIHLPEIFIAGRLHPISLQQTVNWVGHVMKSQGRAFRDEELFKLDESSDLPLKAIIGSDELKDHMGIVHRIFGDQFDAVQILLPDKSGKFPGQQGIDPKWDVPIWRKMNT